MSAKGKRQIREVSISTFKAKCLGLLDEVNKTKTAIRVTRRGRPIAEVFPPSQEATGKSWIGSMAGEIKILGDVLAPVIDVDTIEALKD